MTAPAKKPPPPEGVMLPILFVVATVAAIPGVFLGLNTGGEKVAALPWALLAMGLFGVGVAVFERNPTIDLKRGVKANAFVLFFGPVGARVAWMVVGGGFVGFAIGLWAN